MAMGGGLWYGQARARISDAVPTAAADKEKQRLVAQQQQGTNAAALPTAASSLVCAGGHTVSDHRCRPPRVSQHPRRPTLVSPDVRPFQAMWRVAAWHPRTAARSCAHCGGESRQVRVDRLSRSRKALCQMGDNALAERLSEDDSLPCWERDLVRSRENGSGVPFSIVRICVHPSGATRRGPYGYTHVQEPTTGVEIVGNIPWQTVAVRPVVRALASACVTGL